MEMIDPTGNIKSHIRRFRHTPCRYRDGFVHLGLTSQAKEFTQRQTNAIIGKKREQLVKMDAVNISIFIKMAVLTEGRHLVYNISRKVVTTYGSQLGQ